MGALLSKSKSSAKVAPMDPRVSSSAPAKLENLEGTSPKDSPTASLRARAITPPEATFSPPAPKERRNSLPADGIKVQALKAEAFSLQEQEKLKPAPLSVVPESPAASPAATPTGAATQVGPSTPPSAATPSGSGPTGAAAKRGPKKIDVIGDQSDGQKLAADLPAATAIPDEAQQWAKIYGEAVIRNFHSADWKEREHSLSSIQRCLGNAKFLAGKEPSSVFATTAEMLAKTLKDKVAPIFHTSLELVSTLLASYNTMLPKAVLHASIDPVMPIIVHRCGNLNTRIHESSLQALVSIANFSNFGCSYVGPFALAEPPKRNRDASQAAQLYGRLDLVCSLLATYKSTEGLPLQDVMKFAKQGLDMADEKVRQAAIKVIVEMYKLQKAAGRELQVEKHFGLLKPALMQVLQKRFQEADTEAASSPASTSDQDSRNNISATSTGIKVFSGKSLPPLKQTPSMQMVAQGVAMKPGTPDGSSSSRAASPGSPALRSRPPLQSRERARMSGAPASPSTPPHPKGRSPLSGMPDLEVPGSPMMGASKLGSGRQPPRSPGAPPKSPGALDDAEEQLLQYIMADNKIMA